MRRHRQECLCHLCGLSRRLGSSWLACGSQYENRPYRHLEIPAKRNARSRWARFFSRRERMMDDLEQEIRDHIERETQDNIARGMSPDEAHYAALRKFG